MDRFGDLRILGLHRSSRQALEANEGVDAGFGVESNDL